MTMSVRAVSKHTAESVPYLRSVNPAGFDGSSRALILVLLNPDFSAFGNSVDPDQMALSM